jgi:hypothetical protein
MIKETEMYPAVIKLFKGKRFMTDVPLGPKRIDLVFTSDDPNKIIAVEVKVKNWREALKQALVYQMCADESYVAIHQRYSKPINREKFEELGIGLIMVDTTKNAQIAIPAKQSLRKSYNCATLVQSYIAERNQRAISRSSKQLSPMKFYLWYVATEKRYFESMPDCYDGFVINAHILEHNASAFSALSTKLGKPFFTIPDTHAFQLAPPYVFFDEKGRIRSSWEKLAKNYGPLIKIILTQQRNLDITDFLSPTGSWEQALYDLVANVMTFQKRRVPAAVKGLARFFDIPVEEPKIATYLVAPYFYFTSVNDPWYKISLEMTRESLKYKGDHKLFAVLCMSRSILLSDEAMSTILDDYSKLKLDGFLLWICNFREDHEPTPLLLGFRRLVSLLKSLNKKIVNLHGGFYSLVLHHFGLDGFAAGVCYKESADPTEFPTGGPAGGPVPKYYIQGIKVKMDKIEAALAISDLSSLRCSCDICREQTDYMLDIATPDTVSRELMRRHFLMVRKQEKENIAKSSLKHVIRELKDAYNTFESRADIVPIEHLKRWIEAAKIK